MDLTRRSFIICLLASIFVESPMAAPPTICGFKPVACNRLDRRWVLAKDGAIEIPISSPGRFSKVHEMVNRRVGYCRETIDRWSPPQETWDSRKGDCEDFALLKRAMLKASGIPDEDLFFVLAWDSARRAQHAFLIARQNGKDYILDVPGGLTTMYPVEKAMDFRPWAAFTGSGTWAYE